LKDDYKLEGYEMDERIKILNDKIVKTKAELENIIKEINMLQKKINEINIEGIKKQGKIEGYQEEIDELKTVINKGSE